MDYTFYWFLGIYDYYLYTGDQTFIRQQLSPYAKPDRYSVCSAVTADGLLEGQAGRLGVY